jgi:hypothetical protein
MRHRPLVPRRVFLAHFARHAAIALGLVAVSLGIGILGYHGTEGLPWLDALLNASMILSGMGPVDPIESAGGKVFASLYALFSAIVFITTVGVLFTPVFFRLLHRFHLEIAAPEEQENGSGSKARRA